MHAFGDTPRSFAPSSIRGTRPAAPARLTAGEEDQTEGPAPVTIGPHFESVSTPTNRTESQSASNSSARIRASAVPICWPISALGILIQVRPLRSPLNHIVGSNAGPSRDGCTEAPGSGLAAPAACSKPNTAPLAKLETRKDRREISISEPCRSGLFMGHLAGRQSGGGLDRRANPWVGHAAAEIAGHHGVNVGVGRRRKINQQHCRLHDLSGLAVAALRHLDLAPCSLHWVVALWVQPLDRRDFRVLNGADRGDAGPC